MSSHITRSAGQVDKTCVCSQSSSRQQITSVRRSVISIWKCSHATRRLSTLPCHWSASRSNAHRLSAVVQCVEQKTVDVVHKLPKLEPLDENYEAKHTFTDFANWLIPGHLMLGRYPYVEPSRCRSRDQGEKQVQQILEAGITHFTCLQDELPPQDVMKIGGIRGFLPYKSTSSLIALALSGPPPVQELTGLRNPELDKFLPPRKRAAPVPPNRRIEVGFSHCPVVDLGLPTDQQVIELINQLESRVCGGDRVYLHCWGGRGRAGTIGACFLGAKYKMAAEEALQRVQRAFDTRRDGGRPSPETEEQKQFVYNFIQKYS